MNQKGNIPFKILDVRSINKAAADEKKQEMKNIVKKLVKIPLSTIAISMEDKNTTAAENPDDQLLNTVKIEYESPPLSPVPSSSNNSDNIRHKKRKDLEIIPITDDDEVMNEIFSTIKQDVEFIPLETCHNDNITILTEEDGQHNKRMKIPSSSDDNDNPLVIDENGIEDIFSCDDNNLQGDPEMNLNNLIASSMPSVSSISQKASNRRKSHHVPRQVEDIVFEEPDSNKNLNNRNMLRNVAFLRSSINFVLEELNYKPLVFKTVQDTAKLIGTYNEMKQNKSK